MSLPKSRRYGTKKEEATDYTTTDLTMMNFLEAMEQQRNRMDNMLLTMKQQRRPEMERQNTKKKNISAGRFKLTSNCSRTRICASLV